MIHRCPCSSSLVLLLLSIFFENSCRSRLLLHITSEGSHGRSVTPVTKPSRWNSARLNVFSTAQSCPSLLIPSPHAHARAGVHPRPVEEIPTTLQVTHQGFGRRSPSERNPRALAPANRSHPSVVEPCSEVRSYMSNVWFFFLYAL